MLPVSHTNICKIKNVKFIVLYEKKRDFMLSIIVILNSLATCAGKTNSDINLKKSR